MCSRKRRQAEDSSKRASRPAGQTTQRASPAGSQATRARRRAGSGVVVKRLARAADDGFRSELVPGLHAAADARLLAEQIAFAVARLAELRTAPPGLLAAATALSLDGRREEALWLVAQIAAIGPTEPWQPAGEPDPFAAIREAVVPWSGDEQPFVAPELRGPRGSADPIATLSAYRSWASRAGGQAAGLAGDPSWSAERRFDRAFERLALPGFARGARYDFLVVAGALGIADLRPASLHLLADARDPVLAAAKRAFGFGDPLVVARRAGEFAAAAALPIASLDLGLLNWARLADDPGAGRISAGSTAEPDPDARALVLDALDLAESQGPE